MTKKDSLRLCGVGALVVTLALVMMPVVASADDASWHLRGFVAWVDPDMDFRQVDDDDAIHVTTDSDFGFGLAAEYQFSRRWGVEFSALSASPEARLTIDSAELPLSVTATDSVSFTPISAGVNLHLTPDRRVDFYCGAFFSLVPYGDLDFRIQAELPVNGVVVPIEDRITVRVDDNFGWGALVGFDFFFKGGAWEGWGATASLRYLDTDLEATDPSRETTKIGFDPFIATFGIKYGF